MTLGSIVGIHRFLFEFFIFFKQTFSFTEFPILEQLKMLALLNVQVNHLLSFPWLVFLVYNALNIVLLCYINITSKFHPLGAFMVLLIVSYLVYVVHILTQVGHTFESIRIKMLRNYQTKYAFSDIRQLQWLSLMVNNSNDRSIDWNKIQELSIYKTHFTLCPFQYFSLNYNSILNLGAAMLCYTVLGIQTK